jgi:hypothetical protein
MAITAGATTVMKLIPTPSIIRLMSIMPVLVLRAPIDAPTMTEPTASKPVILYPSFWKSIHQKRQNRRYFELIERRCHAGSEKDKHGEPSGPIMGILHHSSGLLCPFTTKAMEKAILGPQGVKVKK